MMRRLLLLKKVTKTNPEVREIRKLSLPNSYILD